MTKLLLRKKDLEKHDPVRKWLKKVEKRLNRQLKKQQPKVEKAFADLVVYGTAQILPVFEWKGGHMKAKKGAKKPAKKKAWAKKAKKIVKKKK